LKTPGRILFLATDAYGGRGGIALYNRDAIGALLSGSDGGKLTVVPRITGDGSHPIPAGLDWRPEAGDGALAFLRTALRASLSGERLRLIYCGHANLLPVAFLLKWLTGAPLMLAIYGIEAWAPFRRTLARHALAATDHVLSISDFTAQQFCNWSGFDRSAVSIVPNAIHLDQFSPGQKRPDLMEKYGLVGRDVIMLFGRMDSSERLKGFDELIEAMPAILAARPAAKLLLAGNGEDRQRLEALCATVGIKGHVVFTGFVPEAEKADYYRLADAYVMPSRQEGFGFVHLEAMACGVPAVASSVDGAREAVRDGMIGRLIDPADHTSIVRETIAALNEPKAVPDGLSYFGFENFIQRMNDVVRTTDGQRR
jgi:glycosyltransferase involved in cell wall biosynthesis